MLERLHARGGAPAIVGRQQWTYGDLAAEAEAVEERLRSASGARRLVLVEAANDAESVAAYLGALAGGHVVLLSHGGATDALAGAYRPDVVLRPEPAAPAGVALDERDDARHRLHPDLVLLLSTSGSTGSPKLVRLGAAGVLSNALAIGRYLGIRPTDRASLSLPLHYCYGLSILHSNLAAGAAVVLDDRSVVDDAFWAELDRWGATSISGVPHTFELLDRAGFDGRDLPTLRYVTQAGGRLAPETVRRYALLGRERGWDFFVMYGQTEATARIAYLPPELAAQHPDAIGVAIPGGDLRLERGELVYRGPNVMLGYATTPGDLALGRAVRELRTGDLAEVGADGLFRIVGRASRFVKPFGLRVDLDRIEGELTRRGLVAACAGDDRRVVAAVEGAGSDDDVVAAVQYVVALPRAAVAVVRVDQLPRLPSGKPDHRAVAALAPAAAPGDAALGDQTIGRLFSVVLGVADVSPSDTFVDLGGDSLSYVEMSIALGARLGPLPAAWPSMTVGELERLGAPAAPDEPRGRRTPGTRWRSVETNVALRALAIVAIVGSHTGFMNVRGGAHVLLAVAGFNTARFQLARLARPGTEAVRGLAAGAARVAVPAGAWIGAWTAFGDHYSPANVLFVRTLTGSSAWSEEWQYWFVEVLVQLLAGLALLAAVPFTRRLLTRRSFEVALGLTLVGLAFRYDAFGVANERLIHRVDGVAWIFTLGWAVARARHLWHRLAVTALLLAGIPHYFESGRRESYAAAGILALVWVARVVVPARAVPVVRVLAASSLYVYLTHWHLYRHVDGRAGSFAALVVSLVAGAGVWWAVEAVSARARAAYRDFRTSHPAGGRISWWRIGGTHSPSTS
ncbi:MAG TPA: AMP-binding protein [Acidimicrobiales bacterium]|nr:AMP-binding protein [Acidimicrobiales bacterium]